MTQPHDPYAALRFADYRRVLVANFLSSTCSEILSVAVGWEIYRRTGSKLNLGLVGLVTFVPVLLLALPAGHAADHYSRKWILAATQLLTSIMALGLALVSFWQAPVPLLFGCLALAGISRAFAIPARWSLVPSVVPTEALANAMTWNSSGWQTAAMVGPALGGAIVALTSSATIAFLAASIGGFCAALLTAGIQPRPLPPRSEKISLMSWLDGAKFVASSPIILATLSLDLLAVLFGGSVALLPVFASDILDIGPIGLGLLRAAPSVGAVIMALTLAHRPPMKRAGLSMLWAVAGFGLATIGFGLSTSPWVSFLMLALTGACDNISVVVRSTLLQLLTPDSMRGRVTAVNGIFVVASNEVGAFESGLTAQLFGPVRAVVGGGLATVGIVMLIARVWPQIRRLGSLSDPLHEPAQ